MDHSSHSNQLPFRSDGSFVEHFGIFLDGKIDHTPDANILSNDLHHRISERLSHCSLSSMIFYLTVIMVPMVYLGSYL